MENIYSRTRILIGSENISKLQKSRILLFGVGGVGGHIAEALTRAGIGTIHIVDYDTVSESNLNRQVVALRSTVGKKKVEVMKERMLDINPELILTVTSEKVTSENISDYQLSSYDYVIDAVDDINAKLAIIQEAMHVKANVISSMGTGNKLDPFQFRIKDISKTHTCPLARKVRRGLKDLGITKGVKVLFSLEQPDYLEEPEGGGTVTSSISFVPGSAGLLIASAVVRDLIDIPKKEI